MARAGHRADHVRPELNSIGSLEARANYRDALVAFLEQHQETLDEDRKRRMYTQPLRVLDSKSDAGAAQRRARSATIISMTIHASTLPACVN